MYSNPYKGQAIIVNGNKKMKRNCILKVKKCLCLEVDKIILMISLGSHRQKVKSRSGKCYSRMQNVMDKKDKEVVTNI